MDELSESSDERTDEISARADAPAAADCHARRMEIVGNIAFGLFVLALLLVICAPSPEAIARKQSGRAVR